MRLAYQCELRVCLMHAHVRYCVPCAYHVCIVRIKLCILRIICHMCCVCVVYCVHDVSCVYFVYLHWVYLANTPSINVFLSRVPSLENAHSSSEMYPKVRLKGGILFYMTYTVLLLLCVCVMRVFVLCLALSELCV